MGTFNVSLYRKNTFYLLVKNIGCISVMALLQYVKKLHSALNTILEYKLHLENKYISDRHLSFKIKTALHIILAGPLTFFTLPQCKLQTIK